MYLLVFFILPAYAQEVSPTNETSIAAENEQIPVYTVPEVLDGIVDPGFNAQEMADPSFAMYLAENGDTTSAILEWQRLIFRSQDPDLKAKARVEVAKLYIKTQQFSDAARVLQQLQKQTPQSPHIPQSLYLLSIIADLTHDFNAGAVYRQQLMNRYSTSPELGEAERHTLWYRALAGMDVFPIVYTADARMLKKRLFNFPATDEKKARQATLMSFIPGLGHLTLGDPRTGAILLFFNIIFIWALVTALRSRHFAYATVFGFIWALVYVGTLYSAYVAAHHIAYEKRVEAMDTWDDVRPIFFQSKEHIKTLIKSPHLTSSKLMAQKKHIPIWYMAMTAIDTHGEQGFLMAFDYALRPNASRFTPETYAFWQNIPVLETTFQETRLSLLLNR